MKTFNLTPSKEKYTFNKSRIFKRAYFLLKQEPWNYKTFSEALKQSWAEARKSKESKEVSYKMECTKIQHMYNVSMHPNYSINKAYQNGTNVNI